MHKNQVCSSKVKVMLKGQRSKIGPIFGVQSITLSSLDGYRNYFAKTLALKSRSHLEVKGKTKKDYFLCPVHNFVIP